MKTKTPKISLILKPRSDIVRDLFSTLTITLGIGLANIIYIFITNQNPMLQRAGLPHSSAQIAVPSGLNTIDPNDGFTAQALGVESVNQILEGKLPWWNHLEGVGFPLAGGMQSAALFPFTILLLLPAGSLIFHIALELIAATGMYFLFRKLNFFRTVAVFGAIAFGLNGTFAWITNAAFNPIPFLPWLILGVEFCREKELKPKILGIILVSLSLSLSLYSGFPETAYINAILVFLWAMVRIWKLHQKELISYALALFAGGFGGILLAAPILISFLTYLPYSYTGPHLDGHFQGAGIPPDGFSMIFMPYMYGPIWDKNGPSDVWGRIGGYIGLGPIILAIAALVQWRTYSLIKILAAVWTVIGISRIFAVPGITQIFDAIPGMATVALYRYISPSISFVVIILAAFGLQELFKPKKTSALHWVPFALSTMLIVGCFLISRDYAYRVIESGLINLWLVASLFIALGLVMAYLIFVRLRSGALIIGTLVVFESLVYFAIPQLSAPPRPVNVDLAAVDFLQKNIGTSRFYTLGPIAPNYGSYFGIASLNHNDLPVPSDWASYITLNLNDNADLILFTGTVQRDINGGTPKEEFFENIDSYENSGVKYLVTFAGQIKQIDIDGSGIKEVYNDGKITIFETPYTKPYVSSDKSSCAILEITRDEINLNCESATSITRLELFFPGWKAYINAKEVELKPAGIFQQVEIPAGVSKLTYNFQPKYIEFGYISFFVGLIAIVGLLSICIYKRKEKVLECPRP